MMNEGCFYSVPFELPPGLVNKIIQYIIYNIFPAQ